MTQVLVTGGAGFIGSHLVEALVRRGDTVRVLDNLSTGKEQNLAAVADAVELIRGDIRDRDVVYGAMEGIDLVFHQAALVSVPLSVHEPALNHAINVDGTFHVIDAAREIGVGCLVYASSSAVYGDLPGLPKTEEMETAPLSPYGLAKLIGERYARLFNGSYSLPAVGLRYFNVYGPRQDPGSPYSGVISIFIDHLLAGRRPTIYGDGEQTRDFVYVADVVRANLLVAETPAATGEVLNVSSGRSVTINALWATLQAIAGTDLPPHFEEERKGDIRHSSASFEKARRMVRYEPRTSLAEGLRHTLEWYRDEQ
jgi:UDP-glucose 4-epimerase